MRGGAELFAFSKDRMDVALKAFMAWYADSSARNPRWKKIYDDCSSFRRDANLWFHLSESNFDGFLQQQ